VNAPDPVLKIEGFGWSNGKDGHGAMPNGKEQSLGQNMKEEPAKKAGRLSWRRLTPLAVIAAAIGLFFALGLDQYLSFEALRDNRHALLEWRDQNQIAVIAIFIIGYAVVVALSIPGAVWMTIGGGFLFGTIAATLYVVVAATIGATLIFLAARYALRDYLRSKTGPMARKMEAGFRENALSYLLFLRLIPVFPFWIVNLVPAFLGVPLRTYVIGTFLGIIPGSFVYASVGNGLGAVIDAGERPELSIIFAPEVILPIIGMALLSLLPAAYKWIKGHRPAAPP
jgi:uncharacterized membrane protein YdjX (TVP38/TMEM64 family)